MEHVLGRFVIGNVDWNTDMNKAENLKKSKKIWYAPYKFEAYGEEEIAAVTDALNSGWLGGQGPKSVEFEKKIAERFGKKFGVFVNSGSSACLLAIASLDLKLVVRLLHLHFATTASPILQLGFHPVFVDVGLMIMLLILIRYLKP